MSEPRRIALALGSGGARGYAHIGVVRELTERGHEIVSIAGTSMGALVGGLTAAGTIEEYAAWAASLRQRDVIRLLDPVLSAPGAFAANRLWVRMADYFADRAIEDLDIPFTAVATDLAARREVWFQQGPLAAAVRASIAIPGLFTPVMLNGRLLVDGGLTNPIPVDPTTAVPSDLTVAVSVIGPRSRYEPTSPSSESSAQEKGQAWRSRLRRTIANLGGKQVEPDGPAAGPIEPLGDEVEEDWSGEELPKGLKLSDVTAMSFEAMQGIIARYRMAGLPADVVINVPVDACRTLDFHRATEMIELGRRLAAEALDEIA